MVSDRKIERKTWNNSERMRAAESILDSGDPHQALRELRRQYKLQPYQIYAWIGQAAVARAAAARGNPGVRSSAIPSSSVSPFPARRPEPPPGDALIELALAELLRRRRESA